MTIGQISEQTLDQCDVHNVDKCTEDEGDRRRVRRGRKEGKKERDNEREREREREGKCAVVIKVIMTERKNDGT